MKDVNEKDMVALILAHYHKLTSWAITSCTPTIFQNNYFSFY